MVIIANWKMFPDTLEEAKLIMRAVGRGYAKINSKKVRLVVCPPALYIASLMKGSPIQFGAQDLSLEKTGTGGISATMIKEIGAKLVIVGHSERRAAGETDSVVAEKLRAALKSNLEAVLCVGESVRDGEGRYLAGLKHQLIASIDGVEPTLTKRLIIAYEPVWEVGGENALAPSEIEQNVIFIRKILANHFGRKDGERIPIVYGGSVSPDSAESILKRGGIDGLLVGHHSRSAKSLLEIIRAA